jgi:hypothetical protein
MSTWIDRERTVEGQKVQPFTGEGAYHGSTKPKARPTVAPTSRESTPRTLERYEREGRSEVSLFDARFANRCRLLTQLPVPTQEQVRRDRVTFCWTPIEEALAVAGPVSRVVLGVMLRHLSGRKRHAYVDSKLQYFQPGDLPVDSQLWHPDGVTAVRDPERVRRFGWPIVHDLRARFDEDDDPPLYMAYQSSSHCATQFLERPLTVRVPELLRSFDALDEVVRAAPLGRGPVDHPAGGVVGYDGLTLHRAVPAVESGWRVWIRVTETDREIVVDPSMLDCYGTVFRTAPSR